MKSALIFCFLFLYSLSISKSDDRNNYPILSGFKKYSVFKGDSLGISGNPYRRIAGSDSLSSFASLAFRPVSEVSFAPKTLGLPQVSLDLLPFSDLSLYSGSQYGLMYPAAAFTGNIGNDLGLNKGSFYVEFKNSVLSIPKPSLAEAGSFDSFNRKHPIDSSLKKNSVSTKDTLGGSAQANSGVAGADSSTYL
ncbi:MAG: hypothetical protein KAH48_05030, partial [Chlorobi bacterium]|nr:hypothetical protein [Chlorobiota bacterium]